MLKNRIMTLEERMRGQDSRIEEHKKEMEEQKKEMVRRKQELDEGMEKERKERKEMESAHHRALSSMMSERIKLKCSECFLLVPFFIVDFAPFHARANTLQDSACSCLNRWSCGMFSRRAM